MLLARSAAQAQPSTAQAKGRGDSSTAQTAAADPVLDQARVEFERGQEAYRVGHLKQALRHFARAYELAPSAELDFDLARIYERIGDPAAAIQHFRAYARQVELTQDERQQLETRVQKLMELAARQRAQLITAPPSSNALTSEARAFFERGQKLFRDGRYQAALAAFAAARRFAALPELAYNLAVVSERLGRASEAVDYYREYLREAQSSADVDAVQARIRVLLTDRSLPPANPSPNAP